MDVLLQKLHGELHFLFHGHLDNQFILHILEIDRNQVLSNRFCVHTCSRHCMTCLSWHSSFSCLLASLYISSNPWRDCLYVSLSTDTSPCVTYINKQTEMNPGSVPFHLLWTALRPCTSKCCCALSRIRLFSLLSCWFSSCSLMMLFFAMANCRHRDEQI